MPWELMISVVPIFGFVVVLAYHERKGAQREKVQKEEFEKVITPVAEMANGLHKRKYGRPSTDLMEQFPDLKVVK
jgi:hypothetical protein